MCGLCEHNHTPPVYSYSFTCVECTNYEMNWFNYIAIAYLPLTVFYFVADVGHNWISKCLDYHYSGLHISRNYQIPLRFTQFAHN